LENRIRLVLFCIFHCSFYC